MRRMRSVLAVLLIGASPALGQVPGRSPASGAFPAPRGLPGAAHASPPGGDESSPPRLLPGSVEGLTDFDYRRAEISWEDGRFILRAGNVRLKDFGHREAEAREALRIVRDLRLTQHGTIGTYRPVMEYWLSDGRAPQDADPRLRTVAFDPASLRVEAIDGQCYLLADRLALLNFGNHPTDAQQALQVIRRYGFNQVGYIGQPSPAMMYFLADANHVTPVSARVDSATPRTVPPGGRSQAAAEKVPARDDLGRSLALASTRQLTPPPLPGRADLGERVPFDWRQVQVRRDGDDWQLVAGNYKLASFGRNERDARQAEVAVQFYRFTEHCRVGDTPTCGYFLSCGQAPRGVLFGLRNTAFRPEALQVRRLGPEYVISEGAKIVLRFGDRADDAQQVLKAIQHYKFDHVCRLGDGEQTGMQFFARAH
jgi:hypothetical protein